MFVICKSVSLKRDDQQSCVLLSSRLQMPSIAVFSFCVSLRLPCHETRSRAFWVAFWACFAQSFLPGSLGLSYRRGSLTLASPSGRIFSVTLKSVNLSEEKRCPHIGGFCMIFPLWLSLYCMQCTCVLLI